MSGILDLLTDQLGSQSADSLSRRIGADAGATQKAVATALPLLIGGLARNANSSPQAAESLAGALDRDHDGSLLDNLGALFGGRDSGLGGLMNLAGGLLGGGSGASAKALNGDGILDHVLGRKRRPIEQGIAKASGLDVNQVAKLLPLLAPIVMGALGKIKRQQNLDAGGLAGLLGQERSHIEQRTAGMSEGGLASLLDFDGDGDVSDDVAKIGTALASSGLLAKLFGK